MDDFLEFERFDRFNLGSDDDESVQEEEARLIPTWKSDYSQRYVLPQGFTSFAQYPHLAQFSSLPDELIEKIVNLLPQHGRLPSVIRDLEPNDPIEREPLMMHWFYQEETKASFTTLNALRLTCRKLNNIITPLYWRSIVIGRPKDDSDLCNLVLHYSHRLQHVHYLRIRIFKLQVEAMDSGSYTSYESTLPALVLSQCIHLKGLTLQAFPPGAIENLPVEVPAKILEPIATLKRLQWLKFVHCDPFEYSRFENANVERLGLHGHWEDDEVEEHRPTFLLPALPNLKRIYDKRTWDIETYIQQIIPHLHRLQTTPPVEDAPWQRGQAQFDVHMNHAQLSRNKSFRAQFVLESLTVHDPKRLWSRPETSAAFHLIDYLAPSPRVKQLTIFENDEFEIDLTHWLKRERPRVETLTLGFSGMVRGDREAFFHSLVQVFPTVRRLVLYDFLKRNPARIPTTTTSIEGYSSTIAATDSSQPLSQFSEIMYDTRLDRSKFAVPQRCDPITNEWFDNCFSAALGPAPAVASVAAAARSTLTEHSDHSPSTEPEESCYGEIILRNRNMGVDDAREMRVYKKRCDERQSSDHQLYWFFELGFGKETDRFVWR